MKPSISCCLVLAAFAAGVANLSNPAAAAESGNVESTSADAHAQRIFDPARDVEANKSYVIPALDILGFQFLLNRYDNAFQGNEYNVTLDSIRRNLHHDWVADNDPFKVNQFLHPYQGSIYHGFARSAGLTTGSRSGTRSWVRQGGRSTARRRRRRATI